MGGGERHSSMLAQVLADDGHEVDLVGHKDVGKDLLADHLGLNLGKVNLRIVPERGEPQVARLSAEYELFVNASYMSRVKAQAARNLYLCYFPTPFDHDLAPWQRRLVRLVGPHVRAGRPGVVEWGLGWFPPEGGRRRTWVWTSGRASLQLAGGSAKRVVFDLGRPGAPGPAEVVISHEGGAELARLEASPAGFRRHVLELPPSERDRELTFDSDTFVPGAGRPHPRGGGQPAAHGRRHLGAAALGRRALPVAAARPHRPRVPGPLRAGAGQLPVHPELDPAALGGRLGRAVPAHPDPDHPIRRQGLAHPDPGPLHRP